MSQTPGSPVWMDLGTTDLQSSKKFYGELFGWNFTSTGPDFGGYEMIDAGVPVGGLGLNMDAEGNLDPNLPVWWTVYLKVEDIDGTLAAVTKHGGTVFVPPMQIGDMGSMAIVAAPSGAAFGLWQSGSFDGFDTEGRPSTSTWFETLTKDFDADAAFYAAVMGWDNAPMGPDGDPEAPDRGRYVTNFAGDGATAGLCEANAWLPEEMPSFWRMYIKVEDADQTVAKVEELGGRLVDGPIDSPFGRVATVADSLGGTFQVIA